MWKTCEKLGEKRVFHIFTSSVFPIVKLYNFHNKIHGLVKYKYIQYKIYTYFVSIASQKRRIRMIIYIRIIII